MQNAIVATLLSALLFPGSGHLMLKRKTMGWSLVVAAMIPTLYLLAALVQTLMRLYELLEKNLLPPEFTVMLGYVIDAPFGNNPLLVKLAFAAAIIIWLFAVIDSYRIGRAVDAQLKRPQ
ncbi:MAG: hypothetical protein HYZ45_03810 [Burkholderiales bacterium]|nr:hypothetical protein [Burkholderiales bacterium]